MMKTKARELFMVAVNGKGVIGILLGLGVLSAALGARAVEPEPTAELRQVVAELRLRVGTLERRVDALEAERPEAPQGGIEAPAADKSPDAGAKRRVLHIRALVGGHSVLEIQGNRMRWRNRSHERPGYEAGRDGEVATWINGKPWRPAWREADREGQNWTAWVRIGWRAPEEPGAVSLETKEWRTAPTLTQAAGTVTVEIVDKPEGAGWYEFELWEDKQ